MSRKEALQALLEKIEAGEIESKRDFRDLAPTPIPDGDIYGFWIDAWVNAEKAYSGSLDAAKALHDALLPKWVIDGLLMWPTAAPPARITLVQCHQKADGTLWHSFKDEGSVEASADTPARAWLIAILKAHIQEQEQ